MTFTAKTMTLSRTQRVHLGLEAAATVRLEAEALGAQRVFVLAGRTLARDTDVVAAIEGALGDRHAGTWTGITPHVPRADVLAGAQAARAAGADMLVAVGGGSVVDAAKVVNLCLRHAASQVEDLDRFTIGVPKGGGWQRPRFEGPDLPLVCVPTTLSGGEFSPLAGVTDERHRKKQGITHPLMSPVAIVLDPRVTVHTPMWLWLSTGVRSIDHATETLASAHSDLYCDGMADSALRLLSEGLRRVRDDPHDLDARLMCQVGTWQSKIPTMSGVPMGASHAIGHVLGALCGVPHGYTSCVMAPNVQAWNAPAAGERQRRISAALGDPARPAAELLDDLIRALGMPRSLSEVGVGPERLEAIAAATLEDLWAATNPRPLSGSADVMEILRSACV